jgi:hypothetical protein
MFGSSQAARAISSEYPEKARKGNLGRKEETRLLKARGFDAQTSAPNITLIPFICPTALGRKILSGASLHISMPW